MPEIVLRDEARAQQLRHYFTGMPCKHGHFSERRTSDAMCIACDIERQRERRAAAPDKYRQKCRDNYDRNRKQRLESARAYRNQNRAALNDANRRWKAANPNYMKEWHAALPHSSNYRIAHRLRARLAKAIRKGSRGGSAVSYLGCSIDEFKRHIEAQFQSGMTWDNWSREGWHLDHIIPLCLFDLSNEEDCQRALHYSNLQPLWSRDNLRKNKFTTQTCSSCGSVSSEARPKGIAGLGIREWVCFDCGANHDRDVNAARNILALALSAQRRGDESQLNTKACSRVC